MDEINHNEVQNSMNLGGPKTPKGKSVSKFNAITHGILRNSITEYEQEFYLNILEDLEEEFYPQGIIEQIIIERIALCYIKLARLQKAETEYVKERLNPRHVGLDLEFMTQTNENGYEAKLSDSAIEKLYNIYSRYETTIENRLFRSIHELERIQRLRQGEPILPPVVSDLNRFSSFGERGQVE